MKFAEDIFPKGTFPKQQTDGAYIDETLAKNLDVIAKNIVNDMTFMGIITGHDMVGDGKSTMATNVGTYLTNRINDMHKVDNTFTDENMCFDSKELFDVSFKLPALSVICLDEGDDLTTHGMKELAVRMKRYFRKCRQLNQILILILPSFFELPKFYALSRSHFLIDVMFKGEYQRGFFKFYGPINKKMLYLKGKKEWNYDAHKPNFHGRFGESYTFFPDLIGSVKRYKDKKFQDAWDDSKDVKPMTIEQIERKVAVDFFQKLRKIPQITLESFSNAIGVSVRTLSNWLREDLSDLEAGKMEKKLNILDKKENNLEEEQKDDDKSTKS